MLNLKRVARVAVTGGISCGKSQFCLFLTELGAYVASADKIVHQLLSPETDLGKKVIHLLGPDILTSDAIDRKIVAKKVFRNAELLKSLEQITHPAVFQEIERQYNKCCMENNPLFVVEIPLLFEVGAEKRFDTTVAILADEALCIDRFVNSTGLTKEDYFQRMARQLPPKEKAARANIVSLNNGSIEEFKIETKKIFKKLTITL